MDFYRVAYNEIKEYAIQNNRPVKQITINSYLQNIKKISKELFKRPFPKINYFNDHESIIEYMDNIKSISSRKGMCTSIIVFLRSTKLINKNCKEFTELLDIYKAYQKKASIIQNDTYLDNEKSEREEKNWISVQEINEKVLELFNRLKDENGKLVDYKHNLFNGTDRQYIDIFQQYIVINLYGPMLPPIRNDYVYAKIIHKDNIHDKTDNNFNYIDLVDSKLILNRYKTKEKYGRKIIDLPEELVSIIKIFESAKRNIFGRDYYNSQAYDYLLMNTSDFKCMKSNTLTLFINKIYYPKKVSTTILRKVYLSNKYPVSLSMREMERDSFVMGHNIITAKKVYSKIL